MRPKPGSLGLAMPGHVGAVVDDDGNELAAGEVGQRAFNRPDRGMLLECGNSPEATAAKFAGDWLLTGDLGTRDEDGYFWYRSRADDVITSAGYRIGPGEIEEALVGHPAGRRGPGGRGPRPGPRRPPARAGGARGAGAGGAGATAGCRKGPQPSSAAGDGRGTPTRHAGAITGRLDDMTLEHPGTGAPAPGTVPQGAPGIRGLRMPLPFQLDHINLWLLDDGDGFTVVDTGVGVDATRELWERIFTTALGGRPITRVILTHFHPDHIGNAAWLT